MDCPNNIVHVAYFLNPSARSPRSYYSCWDAYSYEWIPKKIHWLSQFLQVYIGPIQNINQRRFIRNLVTDIPPTLMHEICIKGFVVKDLFATFDTTLKPNSFISIGHWWPNQMWKCSSISCPFRFYAPWQQKGLDVCAYNFK
jgi:hypothetical protein